MTQWVKVILLITQYIIYLSLLILLIKMVLFIFYPIKKETKSEGQRQRL